MKTALKLLIACLVVGFALAAFNITPAHIVGQLLQLVTAIVDVSRGLFGWATPYVLLGAFVVIPIWLISYGLKRLRRKSS